MTILITLAIILWLACPVLCYGLTLGYRRGDSGPEIFHALRYTFMREAMLAILNGFTLGPVAVVIALFWYDFGKHGLRFK